MMRTKILVKYRYDPIITGLFAAVSALLFWYFSALAIDKEVIPTGASFVLGFISTTLATGIGAFLAYLFSKDLESKRRDHEESLMMQSRLEQANSVLVELALIANDIENIINTYKSQEKREYFKGIKYDGLVVLYGRSFDGSFNVSKGLLPRLIPGNPNLILKVSLIPSQYRACINAVDERNRFYIQDVEPSRMAWIKSKKNLDESSAFSKVSVQEQEDALKNNIMGDQVHIETVRKMTAEVREKIAQVSEELYKEICLQLPSLASKVYKP